MAIQTRYEFSNHIYEEAYIRIQKISIGTGEREVYEDLPERNGEIVKFEPFTEAIAFALVYCDKDARDKNVRPIHQFGFQFKYDIKGGENPFKEAYNALHKELELTDNVEDI